MSIITHRSASIDVGPEKTNSRANLGNTKRALEHGDLPGHVNIDQSDLDHYKYSGPIDSMFMSVSDTISSLTEEGYARDSHSGYEILELIRGMRRGTL